MRVLILGGSGVLSYDFTKSCIDSDIEIIIANRGKRQQYIDERAKLLVMDIRNDSVDMIRSKIGHDHFDVVVDFLSYNREQLEKSLNIFGNICTQYIFISSATVYVDTNNPEPFTESSEVGNSDWKYAFNKFQAEEYIKTIGINYTIIRPYMTFSCFRIPFQIIPNNYYYTLLSRILHDKPVILVNEGEAITTLTSTIDFAEVLKRLLYNTNAYRQIFNITSGMETTWKDVYYKICSFLKKKPYLISVTLDDIRTYLPEYYSQIHGDKSRNWRLNNKKVIDAIGGYQFKISIEDGLRGAIDFFEENTFAQGLHYQWDGEIDYLIKKKTSKRDLCCLPIASKDSASTSRFKYYVTNTPFIHEIFFAARNRKLWAK